MTFIRFLMVTAKYLTPFMLDLLTDKLKTYDTMDRSKAQTEKTAILIMLGGLVLAFAAKGYLEVQYNWECARARVVVTNLLYIVLYEKILRIPSKSKGVVNDELDEIAGSEKKKMKAKKIQDEKKKDKDLNNILTVDLGRCADFTNLFVSIMGNVSEIAICLYMIYSKVGSAVFDGLIAFGFMSTMNIFVVKKMRSMYNDMNALKDERLILTTDVLHGVKSLKYLNWLPEFEKRILKIRTKEFWKLVVIKILDAFMCVFYNVLSVVLFVVTMIGYVRRGNDIGSTNVFTLIALFGMLTDPLCNIPWAVGSLLSARGSYVRIRDMLKEKEINSKNIGQIGELNNSEAVKITNSDFVFHKTDEDITTKKAPSKILPKAENLVKSEQYDTQEPFKL